MSGSLFSRLWMYQSTPERTKLENFLTEILCDYLNRLRGEQMKEFLRSVFLPAGASWYRGEEDCDETAIIWKTQCRIPRPARSIQPDLIGWQGDRPVSDCSRTIPIFCQRFGVEWTLRQAGLGPAALTVMGISSPSLSAPFQR